MIICNHVLEHIPDDLRAMREIYRVLKPGGLAILQVPYQGNREKTFQDESITDPKQRAEIFGQYDHVRVYGMDYFERLRRVGFRARHIDSSHERQRRCGTRRHRAHVPKRCLRVVVSLTGGRIDEGDS